MEKHYALICTMKFQDTEAGWQCCSSLSASLRDVGSVRKHEHAGNRTGTVGDRSVPIDARFRVVFPHQVPRILRAFNRSS